MQFLEITTGLEFPEGPIAMPDGSVILVEIAGRRLTRVHPNGSKTTIAQLEGGPNGAAMGPDDWCYICNSGGWFYEIVEGRYRVVGQSSGNGWIERVHIHTGAIERLYETANGLPLRSPNDIVFDKNGGFWFTDHGKREGRLRDVTGVYYAAADGSFIEEVIFPMNTPNGIGLSPDEKTLYVAETLTRSLWAFDIAAPGKINPLPWPSQNGGKRLAGLPDDNMLDSLAVDSAGNICVGSLINGGIWVISPDGQQRTHHPLPDIYTTNICFGGPDLKTAFATLSASGRLVAFEWPQGGLQLNYLNS